MVPHRRILNITYIQSLSHGNGTLSAHRPVLSKFEIRNSLERLLMGPISSKGERLNDVTYLNTLLSG